MPETGHSFFRRALCGLCLLLALWALPCVVAAQEQPPAWSPEIDPDLPWRIQADRLVGSHDAEMVEAYGDVILSQGDNYLRADFARYYRSSHWVFLRGNVEANWNGDMLRAEEAEFDLQNQVGWLKRGSLFVSGPHLYFRGDMIRKHWGQTYSFEDAEITACDGDVPAWSLAAGSGQITIDGYARLSHARFRVKDRPVLYAPFFSIPVKTTRQSGLLLPEVGVSSSHGAFVNLPYYWAIDHERDATFYQHWMEKRGYMQGGEFRHHTEDTKGLWQANWMYENDAENSEDKESDSLDDDGLVRANHQRWWLRSKLDADLGATGWDAKLDVDLVSDQNYLREFKNGITGYDETRESFLEEFGRDINENDQNRTSALLLSRDWDRAGLNAKVEYNQSVEHGHGNAPTSEDASLQRLPELSAYLFRGPLGDTPLEAEGSAQAAYFWRREGTTGSRLDLHPELSLPLSDPAGTLIPYAGWRQTVYAIDTRDALDQPEHDEDYPSRQFPEAGFSAFSELYRIFDLADAPLAAGEQSVGASRWARVKHSVQPRLDYRWADTEDQTGLPDFDHLDRLESVHELTYSLTNLITRRRERVTRAPTQGREQGRPVLAVDYLEVVDLRLEQSYDIDEAGRDTELDRYERRPFSDVLADLTLRWDEHLSLVSRTWFSPYLGKVTEHENALRLDWPDRFQCSLGMVYQDALDEYARQEQEEIRTWEAAASVELLTSWRLGLVYSVDMDEGRDLEKTVSLTYLHQCFDITVSLSQTPLEERVEIWVNLAGLNF